MTRTSHHRTTLATRLVALVLLCAFVLQSAAQAGEGCLARVFTGGCCCNEAAPDADLAPQPSCCAAEPEQRSDDDSNAPRVETQSGCACATAMPPSAPVVPHTPDAAAERSWERILPAQPIAAIACAASAVQHVEQRALERPPDAGQIANGSFARTRLLQRGVAGLLSELCTLLR
jgi:hypothetical protein